MIRTPRVAWMATSLALVAPLAAVAQDADERARELYFNGARLYEEGLYEEAVLAWRESYDLSGRHLLLFNMANAYERLGDLEQAISHLNRYRAFAPADEATALERRIANLERRLADARQPAEPEPAPESVQAPPEPVPAPPVTATGPSVRPLPVALLGAGGVGLGVGTIFGLQSSAARGQAADLCVTQDSGTLCSEAAAPHLRKSRGTAVVADVGFAVGLAGLAAGTVVLLTAPDPPLSVSAGPGRVWLQGRFR